MHSADETLLNVRQFDVLLVASFAFHLGRDAADDDDGVGRFHFVGQVVEFGQLAFADVAAEHSEVAVAATVFNQDVVGLSLGDGERLVVNLPASESEAAASAWLGFLNHLSVHAQRIAVVGHQRVFHVAGEVSLVFSADAHRERVVVDAFGKAPGSEG